jgi:hypothetical protein
MEYEDGGREIDGYGFANTREEAEEEANDEIDAVDREERNDG